MKWIDKLRYGRLTRERCEVCGAQLRERQLVEVTEIIDEGVTGGVLGGSQMTATYCTKDAP